MNFEVLKTGFKEYLQEKNLLSESEMLRDENSISIFMHASEFRDYLSDELHADTSTCYKGLDEILKLEIVNGKLVDPNEPEVQEDEQMLDAIEEAKAEQEQEAEAIEGSDMPQEVDQTQEALQDTEVSEDTEVSDVEQEGEISPDSTKEYAQENNVEIEDPEIITAITNDLLNDPEFKAAIDKDGDGEIGKEDLAAFYDTIKSYDNDENTISLDDLLAAVEDIAEGTFRYVTDEEYEERIGEPIQKVDTGCSPVSIPQTGAPSVPVNYGGVRSTTVEQLPKYDNNGKAIIENMSLDELKSELNKAQGVFNTKQQNIQQIQNGEDPELQNLQGQVDEAYEAYMNKAEETDPELKEKIDAQKELIESKKNEISQKDSEIAEAEAALSGAESALSDATSRREALESQLSNLQSQQAKENPPEGVGEKIASINEAIAQAKDAEAKAQKAVEEAKTALETKKEEKEQLAQELEELETSMEDFQKGLCEQDDSIEEQYIKPYEELQKTYDSKKQEKLESAQNELQEAQNEVNRLQTAISERETNNEINQKYSTSDGQALVNQAYQYLGMSESQFENSSGKSVPDGLWCAAFCHEILKEVRGTENLPSWYENCGYNSCSQVLNSARQNNCAFMDANEAQTGDLVIFRTKRGDANHIGFVTKVENGMVYTIEGNTSSKVGERSYQIGSNRINSFVRIPMKSA